MLETPHLFDMPSTRTYDYVPLFLARTRISLDLSDSDQHESLPVSEWTVEMPAAWAKRNLCAHVPEAFRGKVALWESTSDVDRRDVDC